MPSTTRASRVAIPVRALPEQTSAHRAKHDELSVEAPDGIQKRPATARHTQGGATVYIKQPDVLVAAIAHRDRDAAPIGRKTRRSHKRPWRMERLQLAAGAEPCSVIGVEARHYCACGKPACRRGETSNWAPWVKGSKAASARTGTAARPPRDARDRRARRTSRRDSRDNR